jgi:putative Mg2+ transporter-C (MgtC) family protein
MYQPVLEDLTKLLVALLIGAIIGAEREYRTKSAGFRTVILITVGSTLFTIVSNLMSNDARVASNIVTGIGFLGAGAIFKEGANVKGLTTATTIWISAAIGMAIGIGQYSLAISVVSIVILVLVGFTWLPTLIDKLNTELVYNFTIGSIDSSNIKNLESIFKECKVNYKCVKQAKRNDNILLSYTIKASQKNHEKLVNNLFDDKNIISFDA